MNTNLNKLDDYREPPRPTPATVRGCARLTAQLEAAKNAVAAEFRGQLGGHPTILRQALSEAEALAWETHYPHLVFATLAMEKAQAALTWENRQQLLTRHRSAPTAPAAAPLEHV